MAGRFMCTNPGCPFFKASVDPKGRESCIVCSRNLVADQAANLADALNLGDEFDTWLRGGL